jgi:hypothetical protein
MIACLPGGWPFVATEQAVDDVGGVVELAEQRDADLGHLRGREA